MRSVSENVQTLVQLEEAQVFALLRQTCPQGGQLCVFLRNAQVASAKIHPERQGALSVPLLLETVRFPGEAVRARAPAHRRGPLQVQRLLQNVYAPIAPQVAHENAHEPRQTLQMRLVRQILPEQVVVGRAQEGARRPGGVRL